MLGRLADSPPSVDAIAFGVVRSRPDCTSIGGGKEVASRRDAQEWRPTAGRPPKPTISPHGTYKLWAASMFWLLACLDLAGA